MAGLLHLNCVRQQEDPKCRQHNQSCLAYVLCCTLIIKTTTSMSRLCYNAAASSAGLGGKARSLHHPLYLETVSRMKKSSRSSHQDLSTLKPCVSIADAVSLPPPAAVPIIITACHCLSLSLFCLPPVDALAHKRNHPILLLLPNASRINLLRPWAAGLC